MNAKHIIICILATLSLSSLAFAESCVYRYVNTLDGVNVRDKPSLSGKKKFALKCNERVELLGHQGLQHVHADLFGCHVNGLEHDGVLGAKP
mgnify:CR=1 FL=1